jgi:hypothetical protein
VLVAVGLEEERVVRGVMVMVVNAEVVKPREAVVVVVVVVVGEDGKSVWVPEPASARELLSLSLSLTDEAVGVEGW